MINPGTYTATITNHGISETKAGAPQAVVSFSVKTDSGPQMITWYGSFKEKALPITIKALIVCGLKGNNPSGPLEIGKEVVLVIDQEVGEDGKPRAKVQWVNSLDGGIKKMAPELAQARLSSLEGAVMMARQKLGANGVDEDEQIPF